VVARASGDTGIGSRRTSAGRVIAGTARGVRLVGPGERTRPLGDRVKQSLFAILEPGLRDSVFVDLYAGSGAAGIEAVSRGAARAIFVENDPRAIAAIGHNLAAAKLTSRATVVRQSVAKWLPTARHGELASAARTVFLDPPYDATEQLVATLDAIGSSGPNGIVRRDGTVVAKHFWRTELPPAGLLRSVRQERFGDTILTFFRWAEEVEP
jgi:16S rRNA (guanine966-N2)-methyltransferase